MPLWAREGQRATLGDIPQDYNLPCVLRVALGMQDGCPASPPGSLLSLPPNAPQGF